jgi:hypothetical protein
VRQQRLCHRIYEKHNCQRVESIELLKADLNKRVGNDEEQSPTVHHRREVIEVCHKVPPVSP